MRINVLDIGSRKLGALSERVRKRAKANGIPPEEAFREALRGWLERTAAINPEAESPRDAVLEATEEELAALKVVLAAMRSYDEAPSEG